jgi:hypothetical protein
MTPAKLVSNICATLVHRSRSAARGAATIVLLIGCLACERAETRSSAVTTSSPAGTSTAPSANAASSRDEALVRIVHAMPNGAAMDLFAGDLLLFDAIAFKSVTSYRALDGKRYAFAVRPAGMTNAKPLSLNTEGLDDGRYYTVFVLPGEDRSAHLRVVSDKLDRPGSGKARLRIVHGGEGAGAVDVHAPGLATPIFDNVAFQAVTDYIDVAPVNGQVEVRADGTPAPVAVLPNAHLEPGRFYTMVIVGSTNGAPMEVFVIEDMLATPSTR